MKLKLISQTLEYKHIYHLKVDGLSINYIEWLDSDSFKVIDFVIQDEHGNAVSLRQSVIDKIQELCK